MSELEAMGVPGLQVLPDLPVISELEDMLSIGDRPHVCCANFRNVNGP